MILYIHINIWLYVCIYCRHIYTCVYIIYLFNVYTQLLLYLHTHTTYVYIYIYTKCISHFFYYINETPHTGCIPMLVSYTGGMVIFHYINYINYTILYYYTICASYIILYYNYINYINHINYITWISPCYTMVSSTVFVPLIQSIDDHIWCGSIPILRDFQWLHPHLYPNFNQFFRIQSLSFWPFFPAKVAMGNQVPVLHCRTPECTNRGRCDVAVPRFDLESCFRC